MKKFVLLAVITVLACGGLFGAYIIRVSALSLDSYTVWQNGNAVGQTISIIDSPGYVEFTSPTKAGLYGEWWLDPHYSPGLAWEPSSYTIDSSTSFNRQPNGDYLRLMHFGLTELPTPVELSSFTATISAYNYIRLTWVTQTETGMRGYYVFRAPANDLANAQVVSPMIESMNSSEQQSYIYEDRELFESGTYYYWLQANDLDGSSNFHGPVSVVYNAIGDGPAPEIPFVTQLHSVYPNPFSPTVFIPFSLAKDGAVSIKIYNSRGQMVKDFDLGAKSVGQYRISWDGTDHTGKSLANGVYHITMSTDDQVYRAKAVLLR